jgi:hypothetical protein
MYPLPSGGPHVLLERHCDVCGDTFTFQSSRLKRGEVRYCSQRCYHAVSHPKTGPRVDPVARFWSFVDTSGPCWIWTGGVGSHGYGIFWVDGTSVRAHRYAYSLKHGPIDDELDVLHTCPDGDNKRCVRDEHLRAGTAADNGRDRAERGQAATGLRNGASTHPERVPRGDRHGRTKLTDADRAEIRRRFAAGERQTALARTFEVSQPLISKVVSRLS